MKKIIFSILLLSSFPVLSWYPYGPGFIPYGGYGGWGGYPYGAYGAMGYAWPIQAPSFNYNTVIQQSPPVIINNNDQQPKVIYKYKPCDDECFRRYYSK